MMWFVTNFVALVLIFLAGMLLAWVLTLRGRAELRKLVTDTKSNIERAENEFRLAQDKFDAVMRELRQRSSNLASAAARDAGRAVQEVKKL